MAHNFPVPDEVRLERLMVSVYERMPRAEITRLNRIEERLARKLLAVRPRRKVNTIPWWIVLLLAGGLATAAWWAGERWLGTSTPLSNETPLIDPGMGIAPGHDSVKADTNAEPGEQTTTRDGKSPVIYQRENF